MNEELDSQLSAMFDDELPPAECELMARRLSRDEGLKARWGRYAVIGAVIRAERGVRLNVPLAGRVNVAIRAEPALQGGAPARVRAGMRWWQPLAGAALVAGVATVSVLWLHGQLPASAPLSANRQAAPVVRALAAGPPSYTVPRSAGRAASVPSTELANYVVAHSMFSSPVARRNLLSAFITSEPPPEEANSDASNVAQ